MTRATNNLDIARYLDEAADLLEQQGASTFRVNAYRRAAGTVSQLQEELRGAIDRRGRAALEELPGIGRGISAAIWEMLSTGRWPLLERLRGSADPPALFASVPGIGPGLAARIHEALAVDTLEALETAAYDGRLAALSGIGSRRLTAVRNGLAAMLGHTRLTRPAGTQRPTVAQILEIDARYRERARRGELRRIAPRRFNPGGEAWLPVWHAELGEWSFTALFSNTARAHELRRTSDWVVIYYYAHDHSEGQCTVVTESSGPLRDWRIVRGRELECIAHYQNLSAPPTVRSMADKGRGGEI